MEAEFKGQPTLGALVEACRINKGIAKLEVDLTTWQTIISEMHATYPWAGSYPTLEYLGPLDIYPDLRLGDNERIVQVAPRLVTPQTDRISDVGAF